MSKANLGSGKSYTAEVPSKRGQHKSAAFFDIVAAMRFGHLLWDDAARTFCHVMGIEMEDGSGRSWIIKVRKLGEGAIVPTYWHEHRDGGRFLIVK